MPDGTGDDDYGQPSITELNQLSWDITYIRDKLTLNNVSKTLVWRRSGNKYQMILGRIVAEHSSVIGAFRALAAAVQAGADGSAPPVVDFGTQGWTAANLVAMHDQLTAVAARVLVEKKGLTMRMSALAGSNVEFTLGDAVSSNASWRLSLKALAADL